MKGLVVGVANDKSIAWGCVQAIKQMQPESEIALTYGLEKTGKYTTPLAEQINAPVFSHMNVLDDEHVDRTFAEISQKMGKLDFLIHSIAFAKQADLHGRVVDSSAEGFSQAMNISCHSLARLAQKAEVLMKDGGSILTMSYYGAQLAVQNYGIMGPVKAALESMVRYLALELGPAGIRVNAISPGPIMTRAASGINDFANMHERIHAQAPIKRELDIEQVGQLAAFLVSAHSKHITGQTLTIDNGYTSIDS